MKQTCGTCHFYLDGTSPAFPTANGMCRRHAPIGVVLGSSSTTGWQVFPPMMAHQWCGEYRPDPAATAAARKAAA